MPAVATRLTDPDPDRRAALHYVLCEVHDVIGHRLSMLSLHAGGLEVAAGQDPRLRESGEQRRLADAVWPDHAEHGAGHQAKV